MCVCERGALVVVARLQLVLSHKFSETSLSKVGRTSHGEPLLRLLKPDLLLLWSAMRKDA